MLGFMVYDLVLLLMIRGDRLQRSLSVVRFVHSLSGRLSSGCALYMGLYIYISTFARIRGLWSTTCTDVCYFRFMGSRELRPMGA